MGPYLITFAVICGAISYGLMHRPTWMWYVGLGIFYLLAGRMGQIFFNALYESGTGIQIAFLTIYLLGGLVLWIPSLL